MDLSVQPRARRVVRPLPVLRIIEMTRLRLHEEPDPVRVERLVTAFRRDGVLRNPPIVVPSSSGARPEEGAVVLDGANRVTALREAGAAHAAVQVVSYADPELSLSSWRHYVGEKDGEALRDRAARHPGLPISPVRRAGEAAAALARREAAAAIVDRRGAALVGPGADPLAGPGLLGALVALYQPTHHVYRIDRGDLEALSDEYGPGTLVIFPEFRKEEILSIAARHGRLPAGITRHLIPGRVLRLNAPLAWLASRETTAAKQRYLDAAVAQRWREHGVRYYAEPTYLFDE
ncbi:MAG TPA: hypothetical protein VGA35_11605 [bacterium]